jgi:hypothetical protein
MAISANRLAIEPADILTPEQLATRLQVNVSWIYEKSRVRAAIIVMRFRSCDVGATCASAGLMSVNGSATENSPPSRVSCFPSRSRLAAPSQV